MIVIEHFAIVQVRNKPAKIAYADSYSNVSMDDAQILLNERLTVAKCDAKIVQKIQPVSLLDRYSLELIQTQLN